VFDTLCGLLARKLHVVSSCEELAYPWLSHPVMAQSLDERAIKARRAVLGTGINPGFLLDTLPVALTGVCREVRRVEAGRVQDAHGRRVPFLKKIGVGLDLDGYARGREEGWLGHVGLPESLHFVAHHLGFQLDGWEETFEPVVAETERPSDLGPVAPGRVAGVHQVARGWRGTDEVVRLVFRAAVGEPDPKGWVELEADPPVRCVFPGGVDGDAATTAILVNALGSVREAEPGLRTMADVRPPRTQLRRDG
jgi:4-hydroxy-tetrahydrodipicolinate reductase